MVAFSLIISCLSTVNSSGQRLNVASAKKMLNNMNDFINILEYFTFIKLFPVCFIQSLHCMKADVTLLKAYILAIILTDEDMSGFMFYCYFPCRISKCFTHYVRTWQQILFIASKTPTYLSHQLVGCILHVTSKSLLLYPDTVLSLDLSSATS